jgi:hypothetical protein
MSNCTETVQEAMGRKLTTPGAPSARASAEEVDWQSGRDLSDGDEAALGLD